MLKNKIINFASCGLIAGSLLLSGCSKSADTAETPAVIAIDVANMDQTVSPGENFFTYSNGSWMKANPIPEEQSQWGSFGILAEDVKKELRGLVEEAAKTSGDKGTAKQQIGDFYKSGMDTNAIEQLGFTPIQPDLEIISKITTPDEWLNAVYVFQSKAIGPLFSFWGGQDDKNSVQVIAQFGQGGLGLGNRDYYLEKDKTTEEIRVKYVKHIENMLKLIGVEKPDVAAKCVMEFETKLAKISMTNVEQRDPFKIYYKMTPAELQAKFAYINWDSYFKAMDIPYPKEFNITSMPFFNGLGNAIKTTDLETLKCYLTWCVVNDAASALSTPFVNEDFDFYGKTLSGQEKLDERWKRVLNNINYALGQPLGQIYVEKFFPPESKARMLDLIANLRSSLENRIKNLDWMGDATKAKALEKLHSIVVKVGYPDKWEDYSKLEVTPDNYFQNCVNASMFAYRKMLSEIDKPYDKEKWGMSPQTVNAYYSPNSNEIVFPAGILQPPFFYKDGDDAVNYGAIGVVIGHEITHGFDDQGRNYDKDGNLNTWWTPEDGAKFEAKAKAFGEQYGRYTFPQLDEKGITPNHITPALTMGENIADLGGVTISYDALQMALKKKPQADSIDGFTPTQRFFLAYSQVWRQNIRNEALANRLKNDPHSPGDARVNVVVPNIPAFYDAFGVKEGDKLYLSPDQRAIIW
ncbi:MAG: M13 family metallopeptidase [Ignavibacteria bacterium]|jgi:putative endopeptidase|nr:M13 family metallopeptidase [Ignavibacteria bacterium]